MTTPIQFASGAQRGTIGTQGYYMLSQIALRRYADAMQEGATKYAAYNWLKGLPVLNLLDHLYDHLGKFLQGDTTEDHLGHALWNLASIIHYSETRPDLFDGLPPGVKEGMLKFLGLVEPPEFVEKDTSSPEKSPEGSVVFTDCTFTPAADPGFVAVEDVKQVVCEKCGKSASIEKGHFCYWCEDCGKPHASEKDVRESTKLPVKLIHDLERKVDDQVKEITELKRWKHVLTRERDDALKQLELVTRNKGTTHPEDDNGYEFL